MNKVVVGLSGGVDSSVALLLLKKQGFSAIGLTLRLPVWRQRKSLLEQNICCAAENIRWAKRLCYRLNVPYYVLDYQKEFKKIVVDYFVDQYQKGQTPNPCMVCNQQLRFPKFFEFARQMKADWIATGHYAQIRKNQKTGLFELLRAKDKTKDQSYFLAMLSQKQLAKLIFPLAQLRKNEVYQIAKKAGFSPAVERPESQDFCYVASSTKNLFLKQTLGQKPGPIMDKKGKVIGQHRGLHFYTVGQRKGLGLAAGPFYILKLDADRNALLVSQNKKDLYQNKVNLSAVHFISGKSPAKSIPVLAKTRYLQPLAKATLFPYPKIRPRLVFNQPQLAITAGQYAVFYQKEVCLGGGRIKANVKKD